MQEPRGFSTHCLSKLWGSCKLEEGPGLCNSRAGSWADSADMLLHQCTCKALPRKTFTKVCTPLLSPGMDPGRGPRCQQEPGLQQGAGRGTQCPGPAPPARSLLHFQSISEFPGKGPVGTLEDCRDWHHSRHGCISSSHLLFLDLSITCLAALWCIRHLPSLAGGPKPRFPLPLPAAATGLAIAWGDSPWAWGWDITSMCRGQSSAGRKAAAPSIAWIPWSTALWTANKHQILPLLPSKTSSQI